jgi:hypothetical protein
VLQFGPLDLFVNGSDVYCIISFSFDIEYCVDGEIEARDELLQLIPSVFSSNSPNDKVILVQKSPLSNHCLLNRIIVYLLIIP